MTGGAVAPREQATVAAPRYSTHTNISAAADTHQTTIFDDGGRDDVAELTACNERRLSMAPPHAVVHSAVPTQPSTSSMLSGGASSSATIEQHPATTTHGSAFSTLLLVIACIILLGCCSVCMVAQLRAYQRRRRSEEDRVPLLDPAHDPYASPSRNGASRGRGADMAAIGTPARDFVRLSSLPSSALRVDEHGRRCMACSVENECVALRPCGHVVLCRSCSDFVYTCPHCGGYISGIQEVKGENGENGDAEGLVRRC